MNGLRHYDSPGSIYFITTVTKRHQTLFYSAQACRFLPVCLEYHKYIFQYNLYGFVIMPEHLHFIIQPSGSFKISKIMNHIKGNFARKYNVLRGVNESIWQEGYFDEGIRSTRQFINELNYMHYNPVRRGLVALPEDYTYSSYRYYHGNEYTNLIDRIIL